MSTPRGMRVPGAGAGASPPQTCQAPTARAPGPDEAAAAGAPQHPHWLRRAWLWVTAVPLFFIAAMTVGEALYAATGRQAGIDVLPLGWDVLFSVISLAVFLVPCVAAILCARRALRGGQRAGWVPLVLAGATALALTAMTVASLIDAQFR